MVRIASLKRGLPLALAAALLLGTQGSTQTPRVTPKLEPVAETKLLMEGLAHANFKGLERLLAKKPAEAEAWKFMRGQALLIAETGNLLMLRPPKNKGEAIWMERAMDLRAVGARLAQTAAKGDYEGARAGFVKVAASCNRCHDSFRIPVKIVPFEDEGKVKDAE
jgi:cytochrome c556